MSQDATLARIRKAIARTNVTDVARTLGVHRASLASVLIGSARAGTTLQVIEAARAARL
jgi:hypothetical protein